MSPARRIVADHFRRTGWIWLAISSVHLLAPLSLVPGRAALPMVGAFFACLLAVNVQHNGWNRAISPLPLTRRSLARLRWWIFIGVPGAMLSAATLLVLLALLLSGLMPEPWQTLLFLARIWGALGFGMLGLELMPAVASFDRRFFAGFLAMGGALWLTMSAPLVSAPLLMGGVTALGLGAAAFLYLAAGCHGLRRIFDTHQEAEEPGAGSSSRLTGWGVVAQRQLYVLGGVAFLAILFIAAPILLRDTPSGRAPAYLLPILATAQGMAVLGVTQPVLWTPAARVFRTLPLSASRLTLSLMAVLSLPAAIMVALAYAAKMAFQLDWNFAPAMFLLAVTTLGLPVSLRFGYRPLAAALAMFPIIAVAPTAVMIATLARPDLGSALVAGFEAVASVLLVVASYAWTRHELRHGLHAYRPRPLRGASFAGGLSPR